MNVLGVEFPRFLVHLEEISFSCNSWNRIMGMVTHSKRLGALIRLLHLSNGKTRVASRSMSS